MPWNEPGEGKRDDKDPWSNRGGDQGPPDLDEAFKKLQNSLSRIFGGGSGGGASGGTGRKVNASLLFLAGGALVLVWAFVGVYTIDQQERGVVLRFGKALDAIVMPGLHWNAPIMDDVLKINVTRVRSRPHDAEMLTEDENIVKVKMSIQYVIGDAKNYLLQVRDPDQSLMHATESALRHAVGGAEMHSVLTEGREALAVEVHARVQRYMDNYGTGITVTQINIDDTAPPDAVRAAFDDVIKAREDEVRVRNEADAYANQVVPEARGEAQKQLEDSEAYKAQVVAEAQGEAERFNKILVQYQLAPEVTRDRLYLETMESVMANSTKVMIDVEGGNNLLYLPLDRLMEAGQRALSPRDDLRGVNESALARRQQSGSRRERR